MSETREFTCEGCGFGIIVSFGSPPGRLQLCAVCAWLCECVNPEHIMEARRRAEPGGWISERRRRLAMDIRRRRPT